MCDADFIDATVECELPDGHEGDHRGTIEWENNAPSVVTMSPLAVLAGYAMYLDYKYRRTDA